MQFIAAIMREGTEIQTPFTVEEFGPFETLEKAENEAKKAVKKKKLEKKGIFYYKIWPKKYVEMRLQHKKELFFKQNLEIGRSEKLSERVWTTTLVKIERRKVLTGQFTDTERLDYIEKTYLKDVENVRKLVDQELFDYFLEESINE